MANIINRKFYLFTKKEIKKWEEVYKGRYIGDFDYFVESKKEYSSEPVSLFYIENPDISKGHTNYLAIRPNSYLISSDTIISYGLILTNGESCIKDPIPAVQSSGGNYYTSSFNHDYVKLDNGSTLDGGRGSGNRVSIGTKLHYVEIKDGELVLKIN